MNAHVFELAGGIIAVSIMFELMRRRSVKEKYAVLWLLVGIAMLVLAAWPALLDHLARAAGVKAGPNLLFAAGMLVLVVVCVHLSAAISALEDKTRALAEEVGLLRLEVEMHKTPSDSPR